VCTYPPLKAPTGFLTATTGGASCRNKAEVEKGREAKMGRRLVKILDAMFDEVEMECVGQIEVVFGYDMTQGVNFAAT